MNYILYSSSKETKFQIVYAEPWSNVYSEPGAQVCELYDEHGMEVFLD